MHKVYMLLQVVIIYENTEFTKNATAITSQTKHIHIVATFEDYYCTHIKSSTFATSFLQDQEFGKLTIRDGRQKTLILDTFLN